MRRIAATLAAVVALLFSAGSAWADYDDGLAAAQRGDFATAFQEWPPLAEQGDAAAQYNLDILYDHGQYVPQNYYQAFNWYRKAAEQGDEDAKRLLKELED
jgi:TPR repeat protein